MLMTVKARMKLKVSRKELEKSVRNLANNRLSIPVTY